jgi:uncharacterized protein (TIGR03905 family)
MEDYTYTPSGVCSKKISFKLDENKLVHELAFEGGCNGNLKAIGRLVEGKAASEIAAILKGNQCGMRGTSCADQLSKALEQALTEKM